MGLLLTTSGDMEPSQFVNLGGLVGLITYIIWQDWRNGRLIRGGTKEVNADNRNVMQSVLSQMEVLTGHFNHETTDLLTEIKGKQESTCKKLDQVVVALDDIRVNGVRIKQ